MATTATTPRERTATIPSATLEEILLGTARDLPAERGLPDLPDGWVHSTVVQRIADAPSERREGLLAIAFGLVALLWAPLGILAVIAGTERVFLGCSLLLAVVLLAPRPTGVARALDGVWARVRPLLARGATAARATSARVAEDTGPLLARLRRATSRAAATARTRVAAYVADFRAAGERAGDVSSPSGLSDPLSRWVDGQRTPSSTR